jgi:hypothetical protein
VVSVPQCPLCSKKSLEYAYMASTGAVAKAAFDTEDTKASRPQRNARGFRGLALDELHPFAYLESRMAAQTALTLF